MNRVTLLFATLIISSCLLAQKKKENSTPAPVLSPIEAKVAGMKKLEGFINFYYDEKQDKVYLIIDKWDTELIYVESITSGIGSNDIGLDRNQLGRERIVKFDRRGPKVLMLEPNYFYRAISTNAAERKAVQESFAQSVLWGFTIIAEEGLPAGQAGEKVLVDATDFLLQDVHDAIGTLKS